MIEHAARSVGVFAVRGKHPSRPAEDLTSARFAPRIWFGEAHGQELGALAAIEVPNIRAACRLRLDTAGQWLPRGATTNRRLPTTVVEAQDVITPFAVEIS